jgi:hypothetical protein
MKTHDRANRLRAVRYVTESGHLVGEDHPNARLTWELVERMRQAHDAGASMMAIARQEALPWSTVRDALQYRTWTEFATRPVRCPRRCRRVAHG